jgi:deoxyribodipyrimidine photolyase-related protein
MTITRWVLADQLGEHFHEDAAHLVIIEAKDLFRKTRYHRQKAHLVLSAMRHLAAERPESATYIRADTFAEGLATIDGPLEVVAPHSRSATAVVQLVQEHGRDLSVLPARGFITSETEFQSWVAERGKRRLLLEDWYRSVRVSHEILIEDGEPAGGRWNFDEDNRQPPPRGAVTLGLPEPWLPVEDDIDRQVRQDLDAWESEGIEFFGADGPRMFPITPDEARRALADFVEHRLPKFGPYEDALLSEDWLMAHSGLSVPMNLGVLHPREVVRTAEEAWSKGLVPIASVEGFIRQILGWREYIWHLYWHFGPLYVDSSNVLSADEPLPQWFSDAKSEDVTAHCLSWALEQVHDKGWTHHIVRLMILGNWALQRGYDPAEMTRWFQRTFVDGYPWVMAANTVGMALFADGGQMSTKPYASGGSYINKMTNLCSGCRYKPTVRVGSDACPFTAGYWNFLHVNQERLSGNHRMSMAYAGLRKLADRDALIVQEAERGNSAP